ncbi:class I SAM-dependent methyltransferase [Paenibacillus polymyxa]|uniref:class I SAM-dependent methyltransferase n=1 Tax=Paenibacillus polymyxa TaxID=1406 RepID=UPI001BE6D773|nr:class I SAM-dependent methyltransferase [Paenibacillus polymyxa]MBT2282743.1 class I SAM-dependent methyltransferase [Paenibacillus polymyxa]
MNESIIRDLIKYMDVEDNAVIQYIQTEHRMKLGLFWGIQEGNRILEIGCGQGDTTAVLAHLVGEHGYVHGVDIAPEDYGAPLTVGEAAAKLRRSPLGDRIRMDYDFDILSDQAQFAENEFDVIVLSHCSWYLKSFDELAQILSKVRTWGHQLCFAEWDARVTDVSQLSHWLSVLIQSQVECYKENSFSNVRTLFTPEDIQELVSAAGWTMKEETTIHSPELQDGRWETEMTLAEAPVELKLLPILDKVKTLLLSELKLLRTHHASGLGSPLGTYAIVANKQ